MRKKTAFLLALAVMISMTACQDKERGLPDESSMTQAEESDITQTEENSVVQVEGMKETPSGYAGRNPLCGCVVLWVPLL